MIRHNFNYKRPSSSGSVIGYFRGSARSSPLTALSVLIFGFGIVWGIEDIRLNVETRNADALASQESITSSSRFHVEAIARNIVTLQNMQDSIAAWRRTGLNNHDMLEGVASRLSRHRVSLTTLADTGDVLNIHGAAQSEAEVGRVLVDLQKSPHVAHVQFVSTQRSDSERGKRPAVGFIMNLLRDTPASALAGPRTVPPAPATALVPAAPPSAPMPPVAVPAGVRP